VGLRFNPPPGWPPAPPGFTPGPGWQPDPSWPAPPPGWQLWVNDDRMPADTLPPQAPQATQPMPDDTPTFPPLPGYAGGSQEAPGTPGTQGAAAYGGGGYGNPGSPYGGGGYGNPGSPYGGGYGNPGSPYGGGYATPPAGGYATPPGAGGYGTPGAPYGGPYAYGAPYGPGQPGTGKFSAWAIAAFILSLVGGILLSVIFGLIALSRIRRLGQRGRGLAIASLVLSGLWLVIFILLGVAGSSGTTSRPSSTGPIKHAGRLNVFSLAVGDCFDNPAGASTVTTVTATPCNQPHNAQIYAKFNLSGSDFNYPGTAAVTKLATNGCNARTGDVDKSLTTSSMTIRLLFPEEDAWLSGQRTVACMILDPSASLTTSLLNS